MVRGFFREVGWLFEPTLLVATVLFAPAVFQQWREQATRTATRDSGFTVEEHGHSRPVSEEELQALHRGQYYGDAFLLVCLTATLSAAVAAARWTVPTVMRLDKWGK